MGPISVPQLRALRTTASTQSPQSDDKRQVLGPIAHGERDRGGRTVRAMPTAIITGASRGLGLALARALDERGWRLVLDARGAEALEAATSELTDVHPLAGGMDEPR